jgi:hypothetical protein
METSFVESPEPRASRSSLRNREPSPVITASENQATTSERKSTRRRSEPEQTAIEIPSTDDETSKSSKKHTKNQSGKWLEKVKRCSVNLGPDCFSSSSDSAASDREKEKSGRMKKCFVDLSPSSDNNMIFRYSDDIAQKGFVKLSKEDLRKVKAGGPVMVIGDKSVEKDQNVSKRKRGRRGRNEDKGEDSKRGAGPQEKETGDDARGAGKAKSSGASGMDTETEIMKEIVQKVNTHSDKENGSDKNMFDDEDEDQHDVNDVVGNLIKSFETPKKSAGIVPSSSPEHEANDRAKPKESLIPGNTIPMAETEASSDCSMVIPVSKEVNQYTHGDVVLHQFKETENPKSSDKSSDEAEEKNMDASDMSFLSQSFENASSSETEKQNSGVDSQSDTETVGCSNVDVETVSMEEAESNDCEKRQGVTAFEKPVIELKGRDGITVKVCSDGSILFVVPESE